MPVLGRKAALRIGKPGVAGTVRGDLGDELRSVAPRRRVGLRKAQQGVGVSLQILRIAAQDVRQDAGVVIAPKQVQ